MDEPGLEYKTYGLVEVRYVRYALTSLFRVVRGICWAVLAIVPLAVGFFLAQLFHN